MNKKEEIEFEEDEEEDEEFVVDEKQLKKENDEEKKYLKKTIKKNKNKNEKLEEKEVDLDAIWNEMNGTTKTKIIIKNDIQKQETIKKDILKNDFTKKVEEKNILKENEDLNVEDILKSIQSSKRKASPEKKEIKIEVKKPKKGNKDNLDDLLDSLNGKKLNMIKKTKKNGVASKKIINWLKN